MSPSEIHSAKPPACSPRGATAERLKSPPASVVPALITLPLGSLNCTFAPGISAPVVSVTLPETAAAKAGAAVVGRKPDANDGDATKQRTGRVEKPKKVMNKPGRSKEGSPKDTLFEVRPIRRERSYFTPARLGIGYADGRSRLNCRSSTEILRRPRMCSSANQVNRSFVKALSSAFTLLFWQHPARVRPVSR